MFVCSHEYWMWESFKSIDKGAKQLAYVHIAVTCRLGLEPGTLSYCQPLHSPLLSALGSEVHVKCDLEI